MTSLLFASAVFAASLQSQDAAEASISVSAADAKSLVYAALPSSIKKLPGVGIEPGQVKGRYDFLWSLGLNRLTAASLRVTMQSIYAPVMFSVQ